MAERRSTDEQGLTLVEVLVAAVLLGFIAVGLFTAFGVSARFVAAGREDTKALYLAQQKLEELKGEPFGTVVTVATETPFTPTVPGFTYRIAVVDNVSTKTVVVAVYYKIHGVAKSVHLTMERVRP
ncbi:type IV pilus modification PilV family protein [Thermodesulfitimonas sp.]